MRKTVSAFTVFLILLMSSMVGGQAVIAQHTSTGQGFPLAGSINIISPSNITYATNDLVLYVTSKFLLGPEYAKMCYSIDGTNNVTIPLTGTREPREVTRTYANGTVVIVNSTLMVPFILTGEIALSGLSEGPHNIVVYSNYTANTVIGYDESSVCFTVDTNSETSSIPEFPSWTILPLILLVTIVVTAYRKKFTKHSQIHYRGFHSFLSFLRNLTNKRASSCARAKLLRIWICLKGISWRTGLKSI